MLELIKTVLLEILCESVQWDYLLEEPVSQIISGNAACSVTAIVVINVANSLVSALKAGGMSSVSVKDHNIWGTRQEKSGKAVNDKIAIIGMAGRFPGAASHEKLWKLLEKGLDVHREVSLD